MSASEEFIRLVDLLCEYESACDAMDDAIKEGVRVGDTRDAIDEATRARETYLDAVQAYSNEWGVDSGLVKSYVWDACWLRAEYDKKIACIESALRESGTGRDGE